MCRPLQSAEAFFFKSKVVWIILILECLRACCRKVLFLRTVPTNSKVFLRGLLNNAGKADLNKCYRNPKRKFGVTTHFSKIINQQRP